MNTIIKSLVRGYARFLSPIKGYECAHRLHHGGTSCSGFYLDALETRSCKDASTLLWKRLQSCGQVARNHKGDGGKLIIPCIPFI